MSQESGSEQRQVRIAKLDRLREAGINPYPDRFERTHTLAEARELPPDTPGVAICGRIMAMRVMGKLSFATLQDQSGRCQIWVRVDDVGADFYKAAWKKLFDIGDFVGVRGATTVTRTGEPTVAAEEVVFLGKALRPLPEKWHGLSDQEARYRQRYLDLITNEETRERFRFRSRVISVIRGFLETHDFEEVETPILINKASGAAARPFQCQHHALQSEVFLRIAPETYLKRLVVGGYDRVFEFARCFRNEGMDPSHLQDFTMLEYYAAWWNYEDNMRFTEKLVQHLLQETLGTLEIELRGEKVDFSGSWPRITLRELLLRDCGIDIAEVGDADALRRAMADGGIEIPDVDLRGLGFGSLVDQLYKKVSRPRLAGPIFVTEHPIELSPLARPNDARPEITDRFQLVVASWEIVNAYSELVDPLDQRRRLEEQVALRAQGDAEAMEMEEDYLECMEYGMPPISGWGLGIDRLVCLLTNQENLRDVVLFPLMKRVEADGAEEAEADS